MKRRLRRFFQVLAVTSHRFSEMRLTRMAAAISYRGLFALTPLLVVAVWVFGLIVGDSTEAQQDVLEAIEELFGAEVAQAISVFFLSGAGQRHVAAVVGIGVLFWTTSSLFMEIQNDLNDIFEVPYEHTSGFIAFLRKRGLGFLWTVGVALVGLAIWGMNVVWVFLEEFLTDRGFGLLHQVIHLATPLVTLAFLPLLFNVVVRSLTHISVDRAALWLGSFFTTVVYVGAAYGLRSYFAWDSGSSAEQLAGAIFILLLAAFVMSGVFLFGVTVTKVYHDYYETGSLEEPPPVLKSMLATVSDFLSRNKQSSSPDG